MRSLLLLASAAALIAVTATAMQHGGHDAHAAHKAQDAIAAAVAAPTRSATNTPRDTYRHPAETLAFFGVKPGDTVVELWPGGGWYTEILAPLAKSGGGTLYVAAPWERGLNRIKEKQAADAATYGAVKLAEFPATGAGDKVPDGSADAVLTFRNVHNWRFGGADKTADAFKQIFAMLKPGGTLGVVEHRLDESDDSAKEEKSGYMKKSSIVAFAEAAGFKLAGESEINANPKDTKDYPKGVWTLPPNLTEGETDRAKYIAIGESDRMTLKFVKPAS
ncbi:Predicted methyltransferase [Sphingopyxis sp. YR583]|jgi:predicted methyltransferase|uniref:class I SAM-dependent methyltransferase n=1 Tax=Sphingopyxis sp. YR583 TaxID=1881047 RepID=UPI0008A76F53|nr:methyltransferase domain-containing protein [Sphingopyxis sp. YR583]SEH17314.1 Predicted methyltransferase [Sphingopyxis sp. YR583]